MWIPLEKVSLGEIHLKIEAVNVDDNEGAKVCAIHKFKFDFCWLSLDYWLCNLN